MTSRLLFPLALLSLAESVAPQGSLALASDPDVDAVHVLDLETRTLVTTLEVPNDGAVAITPDGSTGFVYESIRKLWVIDLTLPTPGLAAGTNPIPINTRSNPIVEMSVTRDGRYLLAADYAAIGFTYSLLIVDVLERRQKDQLSILNWDGAITAGAGHDFYRVGPVADFTQVELWHWDIGDDGKAVNGQVVQITDGKESGFVWDLEISAAGDRVHWLSEDVYHWSEPLPATGTTAAVPLSIGDCAFGSGDYHLELDPAGDRIFTRLPKILVTAVEAYAFDPSTGSIGTTPLWTHCGAGQASDFVFDHAERMFYDEQATSLWVAEPTSIVFLDPATGLETGRLDDPAFQRLTQLVGPRRDAARVTARNGTGVNPTCLTSADVPALNEDFTVQVDSSVHPAPLLALLDGRGSPLDPGLVLGIGELLIDVAGGVSLVLASTPATGGVDPLTLVVPDEISLVGFRLSLQAGLLGNGQVVLCNALDLVLGDA